MEGIHGYDIPIDDRDFVSSAIELLAHAAVIPVLALTLQESRSYHPLPGRRSPRSVRLLAVLRWCRLVWLQYLCCSLLLDAGPALAGSSHSYWPVVAKLHPEQALTALLTW